MGSNETLTTVDLSWGASTDTGEAGMDHYAVSVDGSHFVDVPAGTTSTTLSGLAPGTSYEVSVTAVDAVGNESGAATTSVSTTEGSVVTAINAGGDSYTSGGITYEADPLTAGETTSTADDIGGTSDDALYQTERYGEQFTYDLSVSNGTYAVQLLFAEIYHNSAGQRVFDVAVEGTERLSDYDLYAAAGHDQATVETFRDVSVSDGSLTIEFTASADNAKVSAIRVLSTDSDGGEELPAVGDNANRPTDPDGDGLYEDVNGDGTVSPNDVTTLFEHVDDPTVTNNVDAYDFNGDEKIGISDVIQLFDSL
ncbi:malectin domain-containing carbohydrate-binding protein [Halomontanus rarus]|uniref:malectin domain-containing carbohydrate-binding protein n=1 Tax=Halomontanus rarus TaxID=3034020 RepID=UPI0023E86CA9|nr:malectin domain-containing carbohydrate-binding protein [Halovivax sp. TS33]